MNKPAKFWNLWAPYLKYMEDNFLNPDTITKLMPLIKSPALVIGAGQGILVEQIQKHNITVDGVDNQPLMIEYARKRRNIHLIEADAANLPFEDKQYKTTIIATGIFDFMTDEEMIESIIKDSRRVTADNGTILAAFYRFPPKFESLMKQLDLITPDGHWNCRKFWQTTRLPPLQLIKTIKQKTGDSYLFTILKLIKLHLTAPKAEKRKAKNLKQLWKQIQKDFDNPEDFIQNSPDLVHYRDKSKIRNLFNRLNIPIHDIINLDSCIVVHLKN